MQPEHRVQTSARAVRRNSALALLSLSTNPPDDTTTTPLLVGLLESAMEDDDRYVRALAMDAMGRVASAREDQTVLGAVRRDVLKALLESKWCGQTTEASPFQSDCTWVEIFSLAKLLSCVLSRRTCQC